MGSSPAGGATKSINQWQDRLFLTVTRSTANLRQKKTMFVPTIIAFAISITLGTLLGVGLYLYDRK